MAQIESWSKSNSGQQPLLFNARRNKQCGSATVEFGLILPILLLILFGVIELGLALYNKSVITNASREGARTGIVLRTPLVTENEIRTRVLDYAGNSLVSLGASNAVIVDFPVPADPSHLSVRVTYTFRGLGLGNVLSAVGVPLALTATTTMVRE